MFSFLCYLQPPLYLFHVKSYYKAPTWFGVGPRNEKIPNAEPIRYSSSVIVALRKRKDLCLKSSLKLCL